MSFELPSLPYAMDALAPSISKETLEFHYGKHHKAYVDKLQAAVEGKPYAQMNLNQVIIESREKLEMGIFNNAAQHWNHSFYWKGLAPKTDGQPSGNLKTVLEQSFGSVNDFQTKFSQAATTLFGSGWTWLVKDRGGKLSILQTLNAENPVGTENTPLLTCDVWEHAYYIDFRNARPKYVDTFFSLINWDFVQENFERKG